MPLHFALLAKGLKVLRSFVNRSAGNAGARKGTATLGEPPINKGSSSQSLFLIGAVWKVITSYYIWAFKPYKIRNLSDRDPKTYIPPLELHMPRRSSFWPVYVSKMRGDESTFNSGLLMRSHATYLSFLLVSGNWGPVVEVPVMRLVLYLPIYGNVFGAHFAVLVETPLRHLKKGRSRLWSLTLFFRVAEMGFRV